MLVGHTSVVFSLGAFTENRVLVKRFKLRFPTGQNVLGVPRDKGETKFMGLSQNKDRRKKIIGNTSVIGQDKFTVHLVIFHTFLLSNPMSKEKSQVFDTDFYAKQLSSLVPSYLFYPKILKSTQYRKLAAPNALLFTSCKPHEKTTQKHQKLVKN